jgi:hypothetical protein
MIATNTTRYIYVKKDEKQESSAMLMYQMFNPHKKYKH